MIKISWRQKLFLFAVVAALIPIIIASPKMIGITQDEVKKEINPWQFFFSAFSFYSSSKRMPR